MSYLILARKYRPQLFSEIIAQEHVTRTLGNAIKSDRLSSGYLFTGPRGTGKTSTARILAKAMNCAEGPTPTPCDKCSSCLEITAGSSLDVLEIDAASNTGVDDIRTLRENVRYLPASGRKRIYIIDEVHRLSGSAFDALLKTLEEPPEHVIFILATTEPHKVPPTIRSRTQRYDFHRVSITALGNHVRKIAEAEKIDIDDDALYIIARKADGSVRDAISLLDQLFAFAGEKIMAVDANQALGLIDRQFYFDYVEAIASKNNAAGLKLVKKLIDSGLEIPEFCTELVEHFRNLLILINADDPGKLLDLPKSELENYRKQTDYFTTGDILRIIKTINNMTLDMKSGLEPRLLLETCTIKLTNMESTVLFEDILAHLTSGNADGAGEEPSTDLFRKSPDKFFQPVPKPKTTDIPQATMTGPVNLPYIQTGWLKFIEYFKSKNRMLAAHLAMVEIREVKDNIITAVFYNNGGTSKQVVEKKDHLSLIISTLREYFKTNLKIRFEIDVNKKITQPESKPKVEKIDTKELLEKDKSLKDIVERFDGEIIGVKKIDE